MPLHIRRSHIPVEIRQNFDVLQGFHLLLITGLRVLIASTSPRLRLLQHFIYRLRGLFRHLWEPVTPASKGRLVVCAGLIK